MGKAHHLAEVRVPSKRCVPLALIDQSDCETKVIEAKAPGPLFEGVAESDYTCGGCGAVLCAGIGAGRLAGVVFRCWCGALNRVPSM